jgi:hypothetical protein
MSEARGEKGNAVLIRCHGFLASAAYLGRAARQVEELHEEKFLKRSA